MDPSFAQGLHALLTQLLSTDTVALKAATAQLNKDYFKNPACIPALTQILASAPEEPARQLAAVELRKRVAQKSGELWINVPQSGRDQIKQTLPKITLAEPSKLVRHSAARVIAAIASIEMPLNQWPDLLPLINRCCTSQQVTERELGVFLLFTVLEAIVEGFQEHIHALFALFEQLLQDPQSADVRVTAVRALGVIAQYIGADEKPEVRAFQHLLPAMINVVQGCFDSGDETGIRQLFDVFETLLILEVPLLSKHIPQLVQFFLQCGANRAYDDEPRIMALNALSWTVKYKKSKVQASGLAPAILEGLMPITTEAEPEDADDDAPSRSALRIIDTLSTALPPAQVFPALRQLIEQYMSQPDPNARRGALLALGVAVEGVSEYMGPHVEAAVWPVIDAGLADSDSGVRRAACTAVGCICEWLEEAANARHAALVPALMQLVADPVTQRTACTALDALLEVLGETIGIYLHLLMETLSGLLDTAPVKVKAVVTGAIGSAAHASRAAFLPYFPSIMQRLSPFLQLGGEGEESELRGITMDAVGTFAEAVGAEAFRPYFPDMMAQAFAGAESENARLRECSFLFFGVMSRVFGEEFAPYLPKVVPALINSLGQDEHGESDLSSLPEAAQLFSAGASASTPITVESGDQSGNVDIDDAESLDAEKMLEVNSAIAVEKEIAADTLGTVFASTGRHFLPFVEQSALELVGLLAHYYEGIRKSATESLLEIVRTFYTLSEPQDWQSGVAVKVPLHQNVRDLINHALPPLLDMYETEDDKTVASALCVGLAETLNAVGPAFLETRMSSELLPRIQTDYVSFVGLDDVCNIAIQILEQKALCQQDPDQDEDEEPLEDQAEYDSVLISSAGDLVAALANTLGADFVQAFQTFFPLISRFYKKGRSLSDRSSAIGTLAEIISGMKEAITPSTEPLLSLFYQALSDEDAEVYSNAAFAVGLLVEHSAQDLSPQYQPLLTALHPHFSVPPNSIPAKYNARDNAAGAVARMIVRNAAAIPLADVLPLIIDALPLKNDYLENRPVFRALFLLFHTQPGVLIQYIDQLLPVFAHVLDPNGPDQLGDETRTELLNLVGALNAENPAKVRAAGITAFTNGV
ncbi:ARM repeat-containing protein [Phellopilus nigrolimitatus]|nr:ARM repeat-containing protein [Phellopilus nigrolimitatus]